VSSFAERLSLKLVGQSRAVASLMPYLEMHRVGLSPQGRPAGAFLLLGPSGTGKTRTVEAIAELLHGSASHLLRVDCGEFQSEHEVAKLLGAPPGYVGHRESQPVLTLKKLTELTSPDSSLAIILFDEIEKAAVSVSTLLLSILDKATLRLGDGSTLNLENTLIFMTSNLGAREMLRELNHDIGFATTRDHTSRRRRLETIGLAAVRKRFTPEFLNRLDAIVTYDPLDTAATSRILEQHLEVLQEQLDGRLGDRSFEMSVSEGARRFLLNEGISVEYGARELKRTVHRHVVAAMASMLASGEIPPGARLYIDVNNLGTDLTLQVNGTGCLRSPRAGKTVLVVDDNEALVGWLDESLVHAGCRVLRAASVQEALEHVAASQIDAAFIDHVLPDGEGIRLGAELSSRSPQVLSVIMTGAPLPEEDAAVCERFGLPVLTKPFPAPQMLNLLRG
jgi:ATP-dependent Clp protease ATP-binding subunit ClpA